FYLCDAHLFHFLLIFPGPGKETLIIELATRKEKGDIAGTKLLKFFNHLERELSRDFKILKKDFEYYGEKTGKGYFILKSRREVILTGPKKDDAKNVSRFKKEHISVFVKNSRVYAKKRIDFSPAEFIKDWSGKNKKKMEEMSITQIKVI
ncbi:MAG: hypothetical protein M1165_00005, partial [Candidatus Pacearchaeota archaeon]|nr:hypothetical protein [Candidatus Pacearchaeota archaeon]